MPETRDDSYPDVDEAASLDSPADPDAAAAPQDTARPEADAPEADALADAPRAKHPDIPHLSYEQARDELVAIVGRLESGQAGLEESMSMWERGEALAAHCSAWLDGAVARLGRATDRPAR